MLYFALQAEWVKLPELNPVQRNSRKCKGFVNFGKRFVLSRYRSRLYLRTEKRTTYQILLFWWKRKSSLEKTLSIFKNLVFYQTRFVILPSGQNLLWVFQLSNFLDASILFVFPVRNAVMFGSEWFKRFSIGGTPVPCKSTRCNMHHTTVQNKQYRLLYGCITCLLLNYWDAI